MSWKSALGLLGIAVLFYYLAVSGPSSRQEPLPRPAPPFTLPDIHEKPVSLAALKDKVVLVDFWATWCDPCVEEIPELKTLHEKFSGRGFTVLGVSMDVLGRKVVAPFARKHAIPYPLLLCEGLAPPGYVLRGLPTAYLVDRRGMIVRRYLGPKTYAELSRDVAKLLETPAP